MFTMLNMLNKSNKHAVLKTVIMVVENAIKKAKGCDVSDARHELNTLLAEQSVLVNDELAGPNMYAVHNTAIDFLSTMIENANGRDVSGAREQLIKLINEQIVLVEKLHVESLEKAQCYSELYLDLEAEFKETNCEYTFQCHLQMKSDTEEEMRLMEVCLLDLRLLQVQKRRLSVM